MDDKPDVGQGTGAPSNPDGELRRDRRRLRESARAEAQPAAPSRDQPAQSGATPETGGFSAFEALGFERRSFEPSAHDPAPVSDSRFRDLPGAQASAVPAPLTPPQATGVTPPAYGSQQVPPVASAGSSGLHPADPPPLEEPPRPAAPPVTHAFTSPGIVPPTQQSPALPQHPPSVAPPSDVPLAAPDAAAHDLRPAAFSVPPAQSRLDRDAETDAPSAAELYSPPIAAAPVVSPVPMPPTVTMPATPFAVASADTQVPTSQFGGSNPSVALSSPVVSPAVPQPDAASPAFTTTRGTAISAGGGHPVFGPLAPRSHDAPGEVVLLDRIALAAAVVLPPVGFGLGLLASARGRAYRGWTSAMARASLWVAVVMTLVFIVGGVFLWSEHQKRLEAEQEAQVAATAHAALVEESAAFCGALAATPVLAEGDAEFGWPSLDDPAGYIPAISAYAAAWQGFAPIAPAVITEQVAAASAQIDQIVANAASLPTPNRAGDLLDLQAVPEIPAVQAHAAEYCIPVIAGE